MKRRLIKKKTPIIREKNGKGYYSPYPIDPVIYDEPMEWDAALKRIPENVGLQGLSVGTVYGKFEYELMKARPDLSHTIIDNPDVFKNKILRKRLYEFRHRYKIEKIYHLVSDTLDFVYINCQEYNDEWFSALLLKIKKGGWIGGNGYDYLNLPVKVETDVQNTWFYVKA